jgi:hypothetical protein
MPQHHPTPYKELSVKIHFRIDTDGGISAYPAKSDAQAAVTIDGGSIFATRAELADLGKTLPMQTLVDAWNSLTGVTPVKRFKDRASATNRIWEVVNATLAPKPKAQPAAQPAAQAEAQPAAKAKRQRTATPAPDTTTPAPDTTTPAPAREGSKKAQAIAMLERGTTREELQTAFGWLPHTTRGFLSILGKTRAIEVTKGEDGLRTYRLAS